VRVIQLLPTISYGDAVSNDTLAMADVLTEMGYENSIYVENMDKRLSNRVSHFKSLRLNTNDVILFHMSIGTELSEFVFKAKCKKKIMVYHNITPEAFFEHFSNIAYDFCKKGRMQLSMLRNTFSYCMADSAYNMNELINLGYKNVSVLPIILNMDDYKKKPDEALMKKYADGFVNVIFVGRIAPNKKQEDVIRCFYLYNKYINPKSRLIFVGSYNGMDRYYSYLNQLIETLDVKNVIFPGHISFQEILGFYKVASVFVCMSEHEGFCVPLVESMLFKVPIIAYDSTAIPETMGQSGIVVSEKNYQTIAELINLVVTDQELREKIIKAQLKRLEYFNRDRIKEIFKEKMATML
jgi:L-malate glycosyltransferase